jgi:hypothetical protein
LIAAYERKHGIFGRSDVQWSADSRKGELPFPPSTAPVVILIFAINSNTCRTPEMVDISPSCFFVS